METRISCDSWWRPLPLWLKLLTILAAFPAWLLIIYCVLTGQAKSTEAFAAFSVFAFCAAIHIIFDTRNRERRRERSGGLELSDGGE